METFKDIKVIFSEDEVKLLSSVFSENTLIYEDDPDFNPLDYGYTQEQIDDEETGIPCNEFGYNKEFFFASLKQTQDGNYECTGTEYILLCDLISQLVDRYSHAPAEVSEFDFGQTDMLEDAASIFRAAAIVLENPAMYECQHLSWKLNKRHN